MIADPDRSDASVGELVAQVSRDLSTLIHQEPPEFGRHLLVDLAAWLPPVGVGTSGRRGGRVERVEVRVEPLHPRHADALAELVLVSGDPDRLAVAADLHDLLWLESMTLLAFSGSRLVGYLIAETGEHPLARVRWLYTRPEIRCHGVATTLLGALARRALLDDCLQIDLGCGTPIRSHPSGAFLSSLGLGPDQRIVEIVDVLASTRRRHR